MKGIHLFYASLCLLVTLLPSLGSGQVQEFPSEILNADPISLEDRQTIVDTALLILRQVNSNIPLQEVVFGVDPIAKLKTLSRDLAMLPANDTTDAYEFHQEITDIVDSLRDNHMFYVLPVPFQFYSAQLPFEFIEYYETDDEDEPVRKYVCNGIDSSLLDPDSEIEVGVEIIGWNGVPMDTAVLESGKLSRGSNAGASLAGGIATMVGRNLAMDRPPETPFVTVTFLNAKGKTRSEIVRWSYSSVEDVMATPAPTPLPSAAPVITGSAECTEVLFGANMDALAMRNPLLNRRRVRQSLQRQSMVEPLASSAGITYGSLNTEEGLFGYIQIASFFPQDPIQFLNVFIEAIAAVPQEGLVIDVRGNGGGFVFLADSIIQLLTDSIVEPMKFQSRASVTLQKLATADSIFSQDLARFIKSIEIGLQYGAEFSGEISITPPVLANCFTGDKYPGPIVALMDGETYSATDLFLAIFQDAGVGTIVGTDTHSGAGGANNIDYSILEAIAPDIFGPLPDGAGFGLPWRRMIRTKAHAGIPVEFFGVEPEILYRPTRRDRLENDVDLYAALGKLIASKLEE